jgi:DNA-binding GntR family transcriptional regulator
MVAASLKSRAYDDLKSMILSGRLKPGQKLVERDLGAQLHVSRTPIREALSRLVQEGLVEARPQRGHYVQALDTKLVEDLYELREVLEAHAINLAVQRAGPADMARLDAYEAALAKYDADPTQGDAELAEGQQVHEIIAAAAHNEMLLDMLMRLYDRLRLFIWIDALYADEAVLTRREHRQIIAAFRARDEAGLLALARDHQRRSRDNVLRVLKARPSLIGG